MSVYTRQDLSVMQAWPLERKIRVTQTKILEWHNHYGGNVAVSFSGGKDSLTLLDLARRCFPDMPAVFVDTGLEYPSIREFVKTVPNVRWLRPEMPFNKVIERYGYPVISKEVARRICYARKGSHWAVMSLRGRMKDGTPSKFNQRYMKWAHLVDAPFAISEHCCEVMKLRPFQKYKRETGAKMLVGTMACESMRRQSAYLLTGCNGFHAKDPTSRPLSFWLESDILSYLKLTGIPYASVYGDIVRDGGKWRTTGATRTGCVACLFSVHLEKQPNRFQRMEAENPKLYDYCITKLGCGQVLDYLGVPYRMGGDNG
ncbi:MAG: phosphoadenosine phosphosulfate reductase family protein [Oscillospiraceae bacterium]|nr:phosphoadenosine phosphosulfate reductase family protein [Oscillospiraceae bacterium]